MQRFFQVVLLMVLCGSFFVLGIMAKQKQIQRENQSYLALKERIDKLEKLEPDLGDSMRELQLEMAKLWYARKFHNDPLAFYELKEMEETIEAVGILKPVVNSVNVAGVLEAMDNSQIADMKKALLKKDYATFEHEYQLTLQTCNQCHRRTGYGFNRITLPAFPPVPNQKWQP